MIEFYDRLSELERRHETFAVATVVARTSPVSSHLGDRAIVFSDGRMDGFVGGSCSRDTVRREALRAMSDGVPRLLRIRPNPSNDDESTVDGDLVIVPMGCASEGAVDVYIEPHVVFRHLLVIGCTPVADALIRLAAILPYDIVRFVDQSELRDVREVTGVRTLPLAEIGGFLTALKNTDRSRCAAVVASQGNYDEIALERLLAHDIPFVGLLASRKRSASIESVLEQQGVDAARVTTIRTPVGLDIGARSAGEVAVSILAQIISEMRPVFAPRDDSAHCCSHTS